jgi:UDP-glucose 4-epimerase
MSGRPGNGTARVCLVTGAAGFIGSNLVRRLREAGNRVIGVDNLSMGRLDRLRAFVHDPGFRFLERDLVRPGALDDIEERVDCVVHLAASKIPRYGHALDTLKVNHLGTETALGGPAPASSWLRRRTSTAGIPGCRSRKRTPTA